MKNRILEMDVLRGFAALFVVALPITIALTYCITRFIEIPANKWIIARFSAVKKGIYLS